MSKQNQDSKEPKATTTEAENTKWLIEFFTARFTRFCPTAELTLQEDGSLKFVAKGHFLAEEYFNSFLAENPQFNGDDLLIELKLSGNKEGRIEFAINPDVDFEKLKASVALSSNNFYQEQEDKYGIIPAFNLEGLALMNHLNGLNNVFICKDDETFTKTLDLLNQEGVPANLDLMLVRVFDDGKHVQPVIIERRDGVNNVSVLDSRSSSEAMSYAQDTVSVAKKTLTSANIFFINEARQTDNFSCYLFTAKDLKQAAKKEKGDLFKELESFSIEKMRSGAYKCKTPPRFFALTQSRDTVRRYIGESPLEKEFKRKDGTPEDLKEKIYRERTSGKDEIKTPNLNDGDPVPSRPEHFARKSAGQIDDLLEHSSVEEIKNIIAKQDAQILTPKLLQEIAATQAKDQTKKGAPRSVGHFTSSATLKTEAIGTRRDSN